MYSQYNTGYIFASSSKAHTKNKAKRGKRGRTKEWGQDLSLSRVMHYYLHLHHPSYPPGVWRGLSVCRLDGRRAEG